ncbi:hypothetical protein [Singulisphaera acidiphila]|uniref:Uncharacterized protein n=1 Tax=Singulisphaera acidiphila (strain ATCC BAA-1392 / DSM 18658 / VKM B-2454 / MOB10) TaxID=886293 RepID=L0D660_SINAD|nr:hypothetical protein [Singulisphaera acidiphila]AGA24747.1 hypothetical protein Sinac_0301 [Singulisphaera acidiphila DSM 18658]
MTAMIVIAMLGQLKAGPTDAFTLNRRSIRAEFDFSFSVGKLDKSHLIQNRLWTESRFAKREIPHMKIAGHWDSDGRAEHTICGPADASGRIGPLEGKPGNVVEGEPAMEVLTDGEVSAFHKILEGDRSIEVIPSGGSLVSYGPFHWFLEDFPFMLQRIFPKTLDHTVKSATINGHKCEYETYYLGDPQSFYELTVCYDPDVNFLPRYIRALTFNATGPLPNQADVAEFFLVDAQRCKSGGFIPMTWNVAKYDIDAFTRRYPSYKTLDPIMPHQNNVTVYNFVGSNLRDKTSKSKLTEISENSLLGSKGGTVKLKDNPKSLSLDQIRARLGSKLTHPVNRVLPTLDYDEKTKTFSNPMWVRSKLFFACVLFGAILFGIFRLHRQRLAHHLPPALMLLGLALTCTGCSSRNPPVSKLSASFRASAYNCAA